MLRSVKGSHVLLTHHRRVVDEATGFLLGAMSDHRSSCSRFRATEMTACIMYIIVM
jgi:hypothetical protein